MLTVCVCGEEVRGVKSMITGGFGESSMVIPGLRSDQQTEQTFTPFALLNDRLQ